MVGTYAKHVFVVVWCGIVEGSCSMIKNGFAAASFPSGANRMPHIGVLDGALQQRFPGVIVPGNRLQPHPRLRNN